MTAHVKTAPSVSVQYAAIGASKSSNEMGMRLMQERAWMKRGEQYLLIKSPPASGKSRSLMFIALDKLDKSIRPREWFIVPLAAVREAVDQIQDGTLHRFEYRPERAALMER